LRGGRGYLQEERDDMKESDRETLNAFMDGEYREKGQVGQVFEDITGCKKSRIGNLLAQEKELQHRQGAVKEKKGRKKRKNKQTLEEGTGEKRLKNQMLPKGSPFLLDKNRVDCTEGKARNPCIWGDERQTKKKVRGGKNVFRGGVRSIILALVSFHKKLTGEMIARRESGIFRSHQRKFAWK